MNSESHPDNTNHDWDLEARLTAYALGELDETEAAELARRIEGDEGAARRIESIRATGDLLSGALAGEPALELSDLQRERIRQGAAETPDAGDTRVFPFRAWHVGGLALAACLVLAVTAVIVVSRRAEVQSQYAIAPANEPAAAVTAAPPEMSVQREAGKHEAYGGDARRRGREGATAMGLAPGAAPAEGAAMKEGLSELQSTAYSAPAAAAPAAGRGGETARRSRPTPLPQRPKGEPLVQAAEPLTAGADDAGPVFRTLADVDETPALTESEVDRMTRDERVRALGLLARARTRALRAGETELETRLGQDFELLTDVLRSEQPMHQRENYAPVIDNPFVRPAVEPKSTFAVDVDTASYSNVRGKIERGILPSPGAIRIEEMINYFDYDYAAPKGDHPFSVDVEIGPAPWAPTHRLVRVGLKGRTIDVDERPATNLVFLVDVSGSMQPANKLPLVQRSLDMLVDRLTPDDRMAIATYAGNSGLVLPSTYKYEEETIRSAITNLRPGGSTNGAAGIELAYSVATEHFIEGGVNRVILCTDGDFNVGVTSDDELKRLIEQKRETGVFLSVLGFGSGNYQDRKMEELSNAGNGHYGYIDSLAEAKKVFVDELAGTLVTIAKDVKVQIDFNPQHVGAYRLIGYENRMLTTQDFRDDRKDAGDIGAGHTVTALYEVIPPSEMEPLPEAEKSRYQTVVPADDASADEMLELRLRYKQPDGETATEVVFPVVDEGRSLDATSADFRFAAGVAAYGMILRQSPHKGDATFASVLDLVAPAAEPGAGESDLRGGFIDLVERTRAITGRE